MGSLKKRVRESVVRSRTKSVSTGRVLSAVYSEAWIAFPFSIPTNGLGSRTVTSKMAAASILRKVSLLVNANSSALSLFRSNSLKLTTTTTPFWLLVVLPCVRDTKVSEKLPSWMWTPVGLKEAGLTGSSKVRVRVPVFMSSEKDSRFGGMMSSMKILTSIACPRGMGAFPLSFISSTESPVMESQQLLMLEQRRSSVWSRIRSDGRRWTVTRVPFSLGL